MVLTYLVLLLRSVLTVACEQTEVLLFDPISSKHIKTLTEAHEDCVNNIRWGFCFVFWLLMIQVLSRLTERILTAPCVVFLVTGRFLDNRLFATCSDDTTIALWDLRKLNSKVCSLHGHASWVKNIEYDTNTRLLVTSGFDGNVITWDMNRLVPVYCVFEEPLRKTKRKHDRNLTASITVRPLQVYRGRLPVQKVLPHPLLNEDASYP